MTSSRILAFVIFPCVVKQILWYFFLFFWSKAVMNLIFNKFIATIWQECDKIHQSLDTLIRCTSAHHSFDSLDQMPLVLANIWFLDD